LRRRWQRHGREKEYRLSSNAKHKLSRKLVSDNELRMRGIVLSENERLDLKELRSIPLSTRAN